MVAESMGTFTPGTFLKLSEGTSQNNLLDVNKCSKKVPVQTFTFPCWVV